MKRPLEIYPNCGWRGFPDREKVTCGPRVGQYRLQAGIEVWGLDSILGPGHERLWLPVGYTTDVGSTPRWSRIVYPPVGTTLEIGYWVHDLIYQHPALFKGVSRRQADRAMRRVHKWTTVTWLDRQVNFRAVRYGGKAAWESYRQAA